MTLLIILASVLLFIVFLLTRFAGIILKYSDDFSYTITVGFLKFNPGKRKKKVRKTKKKKKETAEQKPAEDKQKESQKRKEQKDAVFEMIRAVKELLPKFFGKVHFKSAKLFASIATGDAATCAIACGGAKVAASLLFETIDNLAVLDRGSAKNVKIEPDFLGITSKFDIDLRFRIRIIYLIKYGLKVLIQFIKMKIQKEKQKTER